MWLSRRYATFRESPREVAEALIGDTPAKEECFGRRARSVVGPRVLRDDGRLWAAPRADPDNEPGGHGSWSVHPAVAARRSSIARASAATAARNAPESFGSAKMPASSIRLVGSPTLTEASSMTLASAVVSVSARDA
jgi:hypothetical protein